MASRGKTTNAPTSRTRSARAGITFPVARVHTQLKEVNPSKRISADSAVYTAAILEYISAEILELAGSQAMKNNRRRIMPKHIGAAVKADAELNSLLKDVYIEGVMMDIHLDRRALPTRMRKNAERRDKKRLEKAREPEPEDAMVVDTAQVAPANAKRTTKKANAKKQKKKAPTAKAKVSSKKKKEVEEEGEEDDIFMLIEEEPPAETVAVIKKSAKEDATKRTPVTAGGDDSSSSSDMSSDFEL